MRRCHAVHAIIDIEVDHQGAKVPAMDRAKCEILTPARTGTILHRRFSSTKDHDRSAIRKYINLKS